MATASERASALLTRVFAPLGLPMAFRLWDGTEVTVGPPGESLFALVFPSRRIFRRLMLHPTPLHFGEAYIEGKIDFEGDIFAAMAVGQRIEELRPSLGTRLALLREVLTR